ncbi:response regulator [Almyronema epifaneia]|uniref:Response regulator n=1 Tax=Almyronema epifaneia S1 TaxID=2991925 RepID=A0ABW6IAR9_9CYAN
MPKSVILCVDDEKVVLDSLKTQLKEAFGDSYYYEIAEDAEDALEVIDELSQDAIDIIVIVSDWLMPGMKGDEFLIQVHQRFPQVTKVMLTGQADAAAIERAKSQANLHRCLFKPWSEAELIEAVKTGLPQS